MTQTETAAALTATIAANAVAHPAAGVSAYASRNTYGAVCVIVELESARLLQGRIDEAAGLFWIVDRRTRKPSMIGGQRAINGATVGELVLQLVDEIAAV